MDLEYNSGTLYVRLKGKLERKSSYKINNYLIPTLLKHKIKFVVINLSELKTLDESGFNCLLNTKWVMKINKGKIYLCDVPKYLDNFVKRLRIKVLEDELSAKRFIEI